MYVLDEQELKLLEEKLRDEGMREDSWSVSRFKGLGEMSPDQLWDTTLNPDTRRVLQVTFEDVMEESMDIFGMMMARENAGQRRNWMETFGNLVEADFS
jgi:topoisomerase-4 subunit B